MRLLLLLAALSSAPGRLPLQTAVGYGTLHGGSGKLVNTETLFQVGSISKPVAVTTAMRLIELGKLKLDEDINTRLTTWKLPENEFTASEKVTRFRSDTASEYKADGTAIKGSHHTYPEMAAAGLTNTSRPKSPRLCINPVQRSKSRFSFTARFTRTKPDLGYIRPAHHEATAGLDGRLRRRPLRHRFHQPDNHEFQRFFPRSAQH